VTTAFFPVQGSNIFRTRSAVLNTIHNIADVDNVIKELAVLTPFLYSPAFNVPWRCVLGVAQRTKFA